MDLDCLKQKAVSGNAVSTRTGARGVWVGAQVDPLVVFVGVVSELGWG